MTLDAILEDRFGEVAADSIREPQIAALSIGPFTYFGGDANHPSVELLLSSFSGFRVVMVTGREWHERISSWRPSKITVAQRHAFSHVHLDVNYLRSLASQVPDGVEIRKIDIQLAKRIPTEVDEDLILDFVFASSADFVKRGFGYCALSNNQLVGGVTSAVLCNNATEIQINTSTTHRRNGIATVLAARFLLDCLDRGIEPHWDTGDHISYQLAEKLGYRPTSAYEVLECEE